MAILLGVAISCGKKEIPADTIEETNTTTQVENTEVAVNPNEESLAKAKANPLTHVVLAQSHYDFGKINKGDKVDHAFEITNTGDQPLIITEVKPACGCTAPSFTKDPILPGQKGEVVLSFDSSSFDGVVNKSAEIFANVENAPIVLSFSAEIQPK